MAKNEPLTGPFPDGDSRNLTLVKSDNPIELERTGPQEPEHRREGAPESIMGDLPMGKNAEAGREDGAADAASRSDSDKQASASDAAGDAAPDETPQPYELEKEPAPSAAKTAFDRPTGDLEEPVLQKDWNPAERNSDDLSR